MWSLRRRMNLWKLNRLDFSTSNVSFFQVKTVFQKPRQLLTQHLSSLLSFHLLDISLTENHFLVSTPLRFGPRLSLQDFHGHLHFHSYDFLMV